MQVDWFTVVAQVINFLVLVYLLKRFLYGPIIAAMQRREQGIADRLRDADDKAHAAEEEAQGYRERTRELEQRREALLAEAKETARGERAALLDALRREIAETRARWTAEVERERGAFVRDLRGQIGEQVCAVARRALGDLASAPLEHAMARAFIARLRDADEAERQALAEASQGSGACITVASRFDIPADLQAEIIRGVHAHIAPEVVVRFEIAPDTVCGIELRAPGRRLAWSVESYLEDLENQLAATLAAP